LSTDLPPPSSADGSRRTIWREGVTVSHTPGDFPWIGTTDRRFTLALVLDVGEVLARHGYDAPTGATLVELTSGLYRTLHPEPPYPSPPPY
jgi:hypothetical protein